MVDVKRIFTVNGKPFYPLGRHHLYMGGYTARDKSVIEASFEGLKLIHGNTVCVPIYWDQSEPEEGKFDFSSVDTLISISRRYGAKLILLWFATWKNSVMDFAPAWIKTNPERFKRVTSPNHSSIWVLSSHCQATLEADKKTFTALCRHLKVEDSTEQTVIGLQIENEPGILGSERDYGPEGQAIFNSLVPGKLVSAMKEAGKGKVYDLWQEAGGKESGNWQELFGVEAGELMTAWSIATFINDIAKSGKTVYNIPMFINAWVTEQPWWPIPGEAYPSGGPVRKVLDIYRWFAPYVDLFAPDNFESDSRAHEALNANYARDDNPLFIVESHDDLNGMFHDIADFNAIGYFVHFEQTEDGIIPPEQKRRVAFTRCVAAAIPLLLKYQGTGKIHAVDAAVEPGLHGSLRIQMDLDGYMGLIEFDERSPARGAGLVIQASRNEFYLVGVNFRLLLRPKPSLGKTPVALLGGADLSHPSFCNYLVRVDEGHFDEKDEFVSDLRRNGDSVRGGIWAGPDSNVVRIITCD